MEIISTFGVWQWIGLALLGWLGWDLVSGHVYSYRSVYRSEEPLYYWAMIALWSVVAAGCFWGMDQILPAG